MITPLKKHRGQNGGIMALFVLVAATVVVVMTDPKNDTPAPEAAVPKPVAAATATRSAFPEMPTIATTHGRALETQVIAQRELHRRAEASGTIGFDEKLTAHIYVPVRGWVVDVKKTPRTVKRGTPLGTLFSPDIVVAELELVKQVRDFRSQEELDVARRKLLRWGLPKEYLTRVEQTGQPQGKLPLWAWRDGTIVAKRAIGGLFVEPSDELFTITNPARAWIVADVPEADAGRLTVGMPAKVSIAGRAKPVTATVGYVFSRVYAGMRTVRFELDGAYKRDAAAKVEVDLGRERVVAVPESAVVRANGRTIVYVVRGDGADAREVELGTLADGFYRVDRGLAAGDTVVINAQKLVDAVVSAR